MSGSGTDRGPGSIPDRVLLFRIFEPVTGRVLTVTGPVPDRYLNVTGRLSMWDKNGHVRLTKEVPSE